jgi:hypothetical protein
MGGVSGRCQVEPSHTSSNVDAEGPTALTVLELGGGPRRPSSRPSVATAIAYACVVGPGRSLRGRCAAWLVERLADVLHGDGARRGSSGSRHCGCVNGASRDPSSGRVPLAGTEGMSGSGGAGSASLGPKARNYEVVELSSLQRLDDTGVQAVASGNRTRRRCSGPSGEAGTTSRPDACRAATRRRSTDRVDGSQEFVGGHIEHEHDGAGAEGAAGPRTPLVTHKLVEGPADVGIAEPKPLDAAPAVSTRCPSPSNASPHHRGSDRLGQASGRCSSHRCMCSPRAQPLRPSARFRPGGLESIRRRNGELTRSRSRRDRGDDLLETGLTTASPAAQAAGRPRVGDAAAVAVPGAGVRWPERDVTVAPTTVEAVDGTDGRRSSPCRSWSSPHRSPDRLGREAPIRV